MKDIEVQIAGDERGKTIMIPCDLFAALPGDEHEKRAAASRLASISDWLLIEAWELTRSCVRGQICCVEEVLQQKMWELKKTGQVPEKRRLAIHDPAA
ncbi:MAG: hypothetical protein AAB853_05125 [Patescibacteria group bacterium]